LLRLGQSPTLPAGAVCRRGFDRRTATVVASLAGFSSELIGGGLLDQPGYTARKPHLPKRKTGIASQNGPHAALAALAVRWPSASAVSIPFWKARHMRSKLFKSCRPATMLATDRVRAQSGH